MIPAATVLVLNLNLAVHQWGVNIFSPNPTATKIRSFQELAEGWHYRVGCPASQTTVNISLRIYSVLTSLGLHETDAFPGINGEIQVTAYYADHYFEITIEPNGTLSVIHEWREHQLRESRNLSEEQAKKQLQAAVGELWSLSD